MRLVVLVLALYAHKLLVRRMFHMSFRLFIGASLGKIGFIVCDVTPTFMFSVCRCLVLIFAGARDNCCCGELSLLCAVV